MANFLPAATDQSFLPFQFEGMRLQEACFINGEPYFTPKTIGEFLEYSQPEKAIAKIIERHIYIKPYLKNIQIMERDYRVVNFVGLQLIILNSERPNARRFMLAVANFMKKNNAGNLIWKPMSRESALKQIVSHPAGKERAQLVKDLADREGKSKQQVYRWIEKFGGIKTSKGTIRKKRWLRAA